MRECELRFEVGGRSRRVRKSTSPITMGRDAHCDVAIDAEVISRRHAELVAEGDAWKVRDLDSTNGVFVNGRPVEEAVLESGDEIRLGSFAIDFHHTDELSLVMDGSVVSGQQTGVIDLDALQRGEETPVAGDAGRMVPLIGAVTDALLGAEGLDDKLERVLEILLEHLPADEGSVCVIGGSGGLVPKVARDRQGNTPDEVVVSRTLADEALEESKAVLVEDLLAMPGRQGSESLVGLGTGSVLCVPLFRYGQSHGLIYLHASGESGNLGEEHLQALSVVALMVAAEIWHASMRSRLEEEQRIRARLSRYHSPGVVQRLLDVEQTTHGRMLMDACEATVLFSDLVGFTTRAESMRPGDVGKLLNDVFQRLTDAVFDYEGTVDKFMGDGMLVVFGTPLPQPDHALRAVRAGLRMQEAIAEANEELEADPPLRMRVGIETGHVIAGDIGSMDRRDYTVIGDTVNKASRLESQVAAAGEVAIGPVTWEAVHEHFVCEPRDPVVLKGRSDPVTAYIVTGVEEDAPEPHRRN